MQYSGRKEYDKLPKNLDEWKQAGKAGTPMSCYYNFDPENGKKYGKLYNWYAVNDSRGLAPSGFHIATKDDWKELISFTNKPDFRDAANSLKSMTGWPDNPALKGTNSYGFSATPGGKLNPDGPPRVMTETSPPLIEYISFSQLGSGVFWWTSSEENPAWDVAVNAFITRVFGGDVISISTGSEKFNGFYVRCISDKRPFD